MEISKSVISGQILSVILDKSKNLSHNPYDNFLANIILHSLNSYPFFLVIIYYNKLDKFLSTVIDPDNRIFSRDQLIKDYNYPKEDVYDMELENF